MCRPRPDLRSQFVILKTRLLARDLEHEIHRKTCKVALDRLIERASLYTVNRGEFAIEDYPLLAEVLLLRHILHEDRRRAAIQGERVSFPMIVYVLCHGGYSAVSLSEPMLSRPSNRMAQFQELIQRAGK